MAKIEKVVAREVLDSRGNPTVEVDIIAEKAWGRAIVPSGASTGVYEALELKDGGQRYHGRGVLNAVNNVNNRISKSIIGMDVSDQLLIDQTMIDLDGTESKKNLGANAILGVSMAVCRAAAMANDKNLYEHLNKSLGYKMKMPVPFSNIINGGSHAGNGLSFQEFMVAPVKAKDFREATMMVSETYYSLRGILLDRFGKNAINVGDEGGFAPPLRNPEDALDILTKAINKAGYSSKMKIAIDVASSTFYNNKKYTVDEDKIFESAKLIDYYNKLAKNYPIISIEDPFEQDDFESWSSFMRRSKLQVVGDDLLVTNIERIKKAAEKKMCNALLLKVNQIGTLTQAFDAARIANENKWNIMVSHRSGESEDPFIADLSVALGCGQIKIGAPARGERTCKYNQLLRIEEELEGRAKYSKMKVK